MAGIRYCESCGAVLQDDFRFCETCGAPVRVLASGPSGYGMDVPSSDYGDVPGFGGGDYGYGGFDAGVPGRMTGGNDAFVGAVPPPAGGDVSFFSDDGKTDVLGAPGNPYPGGYPDGGYGGYPGPAPGGDAFGGYPEPTFGGDVNGGYPGPTFGGDVNGGYPGPTFGGDVNGGYPGPGGGGFDGYPGPASGGGYSDSTVVGDVNGGYPYPGSGYDVYPGDIPPAVSPVPAGFEPGYAGDISARPDSRYDEPAVKPKLKSSMGSSSSKEKGAAVSEDVKPYFKEGGEL